MQLLDMDVIDFTYNNTPFQKMEHKIQIFDEFLPSAMPWPN
ncbi:hypothetical protein TREAZ_1693 [Leadbettera azotonutricia ZAS-9]|uniref:Uncharacterized protein n=1 Tax=Leadbettera azotonutricia (strain ATCC BAA-888 / DSM 13862 / ZAS-9) TaxID=545695 RepID=F5YCR1_LEAAZ|nr:hypothetical protein TREAZ_1693 [Leadbettera azotonutricia ZAS-9]